MRPPRARRLHAVGVPDLRLDGVGADPLATVLRGAEGTQDARAHAGRGRLVPTVPENNPETRRRIRREAPAVAFVLGLVALALLVGAILVLVYALGGFGEGSEGAFG